MATMIQSSCSLKWNTAYSLGGSEIPEIDFFNLRLSFQPPPQNILQKFNQIPDLNLQSKEAPALKVAQTITTAEQRPRKSGLAKTCGTVSLQRQETGSVRCLRLSCLDFSELVPIRMLFLGDVRVHMAFGKRWSPRGLVSFSVRGGF